MWLAGATGAVGEGGTLGRRNLFAASGLAAGRRGGMPEGPRCPCLTHPTLHPIRRLGHECARMNWEQFRAEDKVDPILQMDMIRFGLILSNMLFGVSAAMAFGLLLWHLPLNVSSLGRGLPRLRRNRASCRNDCRDRRYGWPPRAAQAVQVPARAGGGRDQLRGRRVHRKPLPACRVVG
jgi:hypothetical protein